MFLMNSKIRLKEAEAGAAAQRTEALKTWELVEVEVTSNRRSPG